MNPQNRVLTLVTINDFYEDEQIFSDLMGPDVLPRKEFINKNARYVRNLDI